MSAPPPRVDTPRSSAQPAITDELVQAAIRAADKRGVDVADVSVIAIAREAGISRSTLLRRLGGTRAALDEAVRARGVDPGGQVPVRIRALDAAAGLISESGLAAATLEAIAARADCSVHSLYAVFGGRNELLRDVFHRHSPIPDFQDVLDGAADDLVTTVRQLYQVLAQAMTREPRVALAMLAEAFARPTSPAIQSLIRYSGPRMLDVVGRWLTTQIEAGLVRDLPLALLMEMLLAPMVFHVLSRPTMIDADMVDVPDLDTACDVFAESFLRAAGRPAADSPCP